MGVLTSTATDLWSVEAASVELQRSDNLPPTVVLKWREKRKKRKGVCVGGGGSISQIATPQTHTHAHAHALTSTGTHTHMQLHEAYGWNPKRASTGRRAQLRANQKASSDASTCFPFIVNAVLFVQHPHTRTHVRSCIWFQFLPPRQGTQRRQRQPERLHLLTFLLCLQTIVYLALLADEGEMNSEYKVMFTYENHS